MDKSLEARAEDSIEIGMRLFDAGPFHAAFGIVVVPGEDTIGYAVEARARGAEVPFRYSLAATLYGDELRALQPLESLDPFVLQAVEALAAAAAHAPANGRPGRPRGGAGAASTRVCSRDRLQLFVFTSIFTRSRVQA